MKNVLILHGSYGNPYKNWYQFIKQRAEAKGYTVNIPQLAHIDKLDLEETYKFLVDNSFINDETIIIGHSSGAAYILGILQRLPKKNVVQKAILVAGFVDAELTEKLFESVPKEHYFKLFPKKWDWKKIRSQSKKFIIFQALDDPYVQVRHAETLKEKLNGELILIPGASHFSISTGGERFKEFPELLQKILE